MITKTTRQLRVFLSLVVGHLSVEDRMVWEWTRIIRDKAMVFHPLCRTAQCQQRQRRHRSLADLHSRETLALDRGFLRDRMGFEVNLARRNSAVNTAKMCARLALALNPTTLRRQHGHGVQVNQARMFRDRCHRLPCPHRHLGLNGHRVLWVIADGEVDRVSRRCQTVRTIHRTADLRLRRTARVIRHWQAHTSGVHINNSTSIRWCLRRWSNCHCRYRSRLRCTSMKTSL